jgi:hypothetical protein
MDTISFKDWILKVPKNEISLAWIHVSFFYHKVSL